MFIQIKIEIIFIVYSIHLKMLFFLINYNYIKTDFWARLLTNSLTHLSIIVFLFKVLHKIQSYHHSSRSMRSFFENLIERMFLHYMYSIFAQYLSIFI